MTRTRWAAEDFPVLAAFHCPGISIGQGDDASPAGEMPSLPDGGFREREFSFVGGDLILHVFFLMANLLELRVDGGDMERRPETV